MPNGEKSRGVSCQDAKRHTVSTIMRMPGMPAEMVPHGCCDHATRPNDASHLGYCLSGFGNEVEHEQRQSAVECSAREGQSAGIRLPNFYSRVRVAPDRFRDKDWRIVDRSNLGEVGGPWRAR